MLYVLEALCRTNEFEFVHIQLCELLYAMHWKCFSCKQAYISSIIIIISLLCEAKPWSYSQG